MANSNTHIELRDMEIYKLSRELSRQAWEIYSALHWQDKKVKSISKYI